MAKVAFLFPGQGSQYVGMGQAAFLESPVARDVFRRVDQALDAPISRLCFEGPEAELHLTSNTQPALVATSIALLRALDERCDVVAGHSLGEYSAHVAAGTLALEQAIRLVRTRGEYMQHAVPLGEGSMAVVLGGDVAVIEDVCRRAPQTLSIANYNCPGQLVLAGTTGALEYAKCELSSRGAKVRSLSVSAPFHCELMRGAEQRFEPVLRSAHWHTPKLPVYVNVDGSPIQSARNACTALARQVSRPVYWQQTIERMLADGVGLFVEIGPGRALSGMLRRIARQSASLNVETPADFEAARAAIRRQREAASCSPMSSVLN